MVIIEQGGRAGKQCTKCGIWKPLEEYYARKPFVGDGYFNQCKECQRERKRAKRAEDPELHRERARRWKEANPERTQQARNRWRETNRAAEQERARVRRERIGDELRRYDRGYYARNYERLFARQRQRRAEHPELAREHGRRWRQRHPDQVKALKRRRRARLALTPGAHTEAQWRALKARYGHRCLRCGRREPEVVLTRDHVIPLGQPGASDGIENIQPLCGPCNSWKGRRRLDYRRAS